MPNILEVVCPYCQKEFEVEMPTKAGTKSSAGRTIEHKPVAEMSNEDLKREIINANSVLYKAKKRGADQKVIDANQARVDAAYAEKEKRAPARVTATVKEDDAATPEAATSEDVYVNPEVTNQI